MAPLPSKEDVAKRKTAKRALGDLGEDIAIRFLAQRGFLVLERNFLTRWGELDVIAQRASGSADALVLHFIEVKTAQVAANGPAPEEHLTPDKLASLGKAIEIYRSKRRVFDFSYQLDAVIVRIDLEEREARVRYLPNVHL
ncbi:hypothetical protein GVX82_02385 [Patescibacteria group bacterium]|jgi:putative endonuclease|nr:hypothetical protein [Patescibacteria group bacterium]